MPAPTSSRSQSALAASLLLGLAALAALPSPRPSSAGPQPPLVSGPLSGRALGAVLEGDGPSPENLPPGALPAAPAIAAQEPLPAPSAGGPVDFRHYPTPEEISRFLADLEQAHPHLVERYTIGHSWQGRPIEALRLGRRDLPEAIADRSITLIDAQHHARELVSAQVALYNAWHLLAGYGTDPVATRLLDTRVIHVIPSVNVDGNAVALSDNQDNRKTLNPSCCDDDNDGKVDEDPPLNYGYGNHSLTRYRFQQAWADANPTNPFVGDWRAQLLGTPEPLGRFTGALGGEQRPIARADADGDGRTQEDPIGGVDPNRNYDWHWEAGDTQVRSSSYRGPAVWSEPEVRALRDYAAELSTLAASVSYHSGIDLLLYPWAHSQTEALPDAGFYELLSAKGSQLTEVHGFQGTVRTWTARGLYEAMGSSMDYLYARQGAFAFAPETFGDSGMTVIQRLGSTGTFTSGQATGFAFNPRPDKILATADRWNRWTRYLIAATPYVGLNTLAVDETELTITLGSEGIMPIRLTTTLVHPDGRRQDLGLAADRVLHAEQLSRRLPLAELAPGRYRLECEATLATGTRPHPVARGAWVFDLGPTGPALVEGRLVPYVDLSPHFDGWWAGPEWNEPRYRCSREPCQPQILVTPPVMPTVAMATATAGSPTTAAATATPVGAGLFLPWVERR